MAIKQDNSDLPKDRPPGNPPDEHPRFGQMLAQAWYDADRAEGHTKSRTDVERYIRLGWGGKCARDLAYRLLDVEPSNPPDIAGVWRMGLGTMVHEKLQDVMAAAFPDASIEHVVGAEHDEKFGFPTSGRTDIFLIENEAPETAKAIKRTVIEVKTINGFGFKKAIGSRGIAEGPRTGAIYQAALNARALDADEVVITYLSLECLSDRELAGLVSSSGGEADPIRKFVAEWTYSAEDLADMTEREVKRLTRVMEMTDRVAKAVPGDMEAPLPPRSIPLEMPARARVTDPAKGTWQLVIDGNVLEAGSTWWCGYCDYRDRCIADGAS